MNETPWRPFSIRYDIFETAKTMSNSINKNSYETKKIISTLLSKFVFVKNGLITIPELSSNSFTIVPTLELL